MVSKKIVITNKTGLHARPAAQFTRMANGFHADIIVKNLDTGKEGNAKSIIAIIAMGLAKGVEMEIRAEGDDEHKAVEDLIALVEGKFGEE